MTKRTEAIVVLGCKLRVDSRGTLSEHGVLAHRLEAAAHAYAQRGPERTIVVASGGRRWGRFVEADVMVHELVRRGVPESSMVRERCSLSTRDNARFTAALLARREIDRAIVVTSDWHLRRAVAFFSQTGLLVEGIPAYHSAPWPTRVRRRTTERLLMWLQAALVVVLGAGCSKGAPTAPVPLDAGPGPQTVLRSIERAEDLRRAKDIPEDVRRSRDRAIRQRAVRALARILDSDDTPLLRALEDDDEETVTWAGYGLGESCRGREESHVRALAARLESLDDSAGHDAPHARAAIVRALGRCGGDRAEQTLRGCLERREAAGTSEAGSAKFDEAAAYAFGDVAAQRGSLSTASAAALVDAALANPPLDAALYPFGRIDEPLGEELEPRLFAAARSAFDRPGPERIFAVRALGHTNPRRAAAELARVLTSDAFTPAERAEAARTLGRLRNTGQQALAVALKSIVPDAASLTTDRFGVVLTALMSLGDGVEDGAQETLRTIAHIALPSGSPPALARRISALRCAAGERLAWDAWESAAIRDCDVADGESGERARLAALERGQLVKARRTVWLELARKTTHVRVRERAIEAVAHHPELADVARDLLAEALVGTAPGVVATAANVIRAHPDRFYVLAERERRDALDPSAPTPKASPARELDSRIAAALRSAIAHRWSEDLVETRAALVDAALSVGLDEARAFALAACHDANVTMRARASTALAAAGVMTNCPLEDGAFVPASEIDRPISHPTRVVFETDASVLGIVFDPALAPMAATRFVALARSGFYTGMAVHRVVPGFVVQLGDPGGDGYGGSGSLLRCETSPVPFRSLDVGVALAGRDTGSSQFFVVLARYPHLDGQYTWVGRADGDWNAVTEGDLVHRVRLEE